MAYWSSSPTKVSISISSSNDIEEVVGTDRGTIEADTISIGSAIGGKWGSRLDKIEEICISSQDEEGAVLVEEL